MTVERILDHKQRGLDRLLEQYKGLVNIESIISAYTEQFQELEDVFHRIRIERTLDAARGQQLDNIGDVVVQDRQGFDDDFYKILLFVKIGQNTSFGEPEKLISIFKLITSATKVHYQNLGNAQIMLASNGTIDSTLVDFIFENMQKVTAGGVRLNFIELFSPNDEAFAFDGSPSQDLGFGDATAPTIGGKFAQLLLPNAPAFAMGDATGEPENALGGFGTLDDPLAGGVFQGI